MIQEQINAIEWLTDQFMAQAEEIHKDVYGSTLDSNRATEIYMTILKGRLIDIKYEARKIYYEALHDEFKRGLDIGHDIGKRVWGNK